MNILSNDVAERLGEKSAAVLAAAEEFVAGANTLTVKTTGSTDVADDGDLSVEVKPTTKTVIFISKGLYNTDPRHAANAVRAAVEENTSVRYI